MERKSGRMGQSTLEIIRMERSMETASLYERMAPSIPGSLLKITSTGLAIISGLMDADTRDSGREIKCMEKAPFFGKMEGFIKAVTFMIKRRDTASFFGRMAGNTLACGIVNFPNLKKKKKKKNILQRWQTAWRRNL